MTDRPDHDYYFLTAVIDETRDGMECGTALADVKAMIPTYDENQILIFKGNLSTGFVDVSEDIAREMLDDCIAEFLYVFDPLEFIQEHVTNHEAIVEEAIENAAADRAHGRTESMQSTYI